jgi:hypothetical protein
MSRRTVGLPIKIDRPGASARLGYRSRLWIQNPSPNKRRRNGLSLSTGLCQATWQCNTGCPELSWSPVQVPTMTPPPGHTMHLGHACTLRFCARAALLLPRRHTGAADPTLPSSSPHRTTATGFRTAWNGFKDASETVATSATHGVPNQRVLSRVTSPLRTQDAGVLDHGHVGHLRVSRVLLLLPRTVVRATIVVNILPALRNYLELASVCYLLFISSARDFCIEFNCCGKTR